VDRGVDQQRRREAGDVGEILGIARFKFHEGKVEEYKRLSAQAMEIVRTKDSGTLQFDTYFNDDESECMVIERYRDSAAAIEHWENLRELSETILTLVSVVHGEVLGEVSAELRMDLADGPVQLFTPYRSMWIPIRARRRRSNRDPCVACRKGRQEIGHVPSWLQKCRLSQGEPQGRGPCDF
jgi:quinol monooxygenase YgiN